MDKEFVADAIDSAIASVGRNEFTRLSRGSSISQQASKVSGALNSLKDLQSGGLPVYADEWVGLFYLLWYQPKQINLAYSMIKDLVSKKQSGRLIQGDRLHVVDFGCGALAMQFGVALAAADALESGQVIKIVRIDSFDQCEPMITLGETLWEAFEERIQTRPTVHELNSVCQMMQCNHYNDAASLNNAVDSLARGDRWLSAIHTIYEVNELSVRESLNFLKSQLNPDRGFVTTFNYKESLAQSVSPFYGSSEYRQVFGQIGQEFVGDLPKIKDYRMHICDHILQRLGTSYGQDGNIDIGLIENYLRTEVTWRWPDACFLAYERR